jgi:hypothetical protein
VSLKKLTFTIIKPKWRIYQATVVVPSCATRATDFDLLIKRGLLLLSFKNEKKGDTTKKQKQNTKQKAGNYII